jgi:uncharacterized repeat protein (TIGR03803 family)
MKYARQQNKPFRMFAAFMAAIVILGLAGVAVPAQAQTYSVIYEATGDPGIANPEGEAIALGRDGKLYTTDLSSGVFQGVFSFTTGGAVTLVNNVGGYPAGGVTLGTDGNFYGVNQNGGIFVNCGISNGGQLYQLTPAGTQTVFHNFTGNGDGCNPYSAPIQAANGVYYGTTPSDNAFVAQNSTIYTLTSAGAFATLHTFTGPDGQNVYAPLVQGSDGNFYGVAAAGGTNGMGVIFKMAPSGTVTVLHNFTGIDGCSAYTALIQASDGNFYGTAPCGTGGGSAGVVFKITRGGVYTVLYYTPSGDTSVPVSSLVQAADGKLYGVTSAGSNGTFGTIYSITTTGTFAVVHTFANTDGNNPSSPLRQHTNGLLYGATYSGGDLSQCNLGGCGVLYSLNIGATPFVSLVSASGKEGARIGIEGQGFSHSSVVKFGGVQAASITFSGSTFITATVPSAALTGQVTVTTGTTTLTSNNTFRVTPTFPSFSPPNGTVGTPVTLTGTGLAQTTKVTFGGVAATVVTVNSDIQVTANVPTGAKTGKIVVTTKGGSVSSTTNFTVN